VSYFLFALILFPILVLKVFPNQSLILLSLRLVCFVFFTLIKVLFAAEVNRLTLDTCLLLIFNTCFFGSQWYLDSKLMSTDFSEVFSP
jgi:hypothetical protein